MTERALILRTIETARQARQSGDLAALISQLAPDARYRLVMGNPMPPACDARLALAEMTGQFRFDTFDTYDILIDGDRAAIRLRASTTSAEGAVMQTEIASFWTFDDHGLITEMIDFTDTALIEQLANAT